jgi:hypothetical protein
MHFLAISRPETHKKAINSPIPFNWSYFRPKSGQKCEWMPFLGVSRPEKHKKTINLPISFN